MQAIQGTYETHLGKFMLEMLDRQLEMVLCWTFMTRELAGDVEAVVAFATVIMTCSFRP